MVVVVVVIVQCDLNYRKSAEQGVNYVRRMFIGTGSVGDDAGDTIAVTDTRQQ